MLFCQQQRVVWWAVFSGHLHLTTFFSAASESQLIHKNGSLGCCSGSQYQRSAVECLTKYASPAKVGVTRSAAMRSMGSTVLASQIASGRSTIGCSGRQKLKRHQGKPGYSIQDAYLTMSLRYLGSEYISHSAAVQCLLIRGTPPSSETSTMDQWPDQRGKMIQTCMNQLKWLRMHGTIT